MSLRTNNGVSLATAFLLALSLTGCVKEEPLPEDEIARVNDRVLTSAEVAAWELSLRQPYVPEELRVSYILHWVERELLYQEAVKRDLLNDPWVAERVEDATRSILVSRLLEQEYRNILTLTPAEIRLYYLDHVNEFIWDKEHISVQYWRSRTRKGMDALRVALLRGRQDALWKGDPGALEQGSLSLKQTEVADQSLWQLLNWLSEGKLSQVIPLEGSFWVFKVIEKSQAGDRKALEDVHDEVVARLSEERRQRHKASFIQHLVLEYHRSGQLRWSEAVDTVARADTTAKATREP